MTKENDEEIIKIFIAASIGGFTSYIFEEFIKEWNIIAFIVGLTISLISITFLIKFYQKFLKNIKKKKDFIFNINKGNIETVAHFGAIISVIIALLSLSSSYDLFNKNLEIQKQLEFDDHLSNIRSLELELAKDFNLTRDLNNKIKTDDGKKQAYFAKLITENLQRSVIDGKISNEYGKKHLIYTLFYDIELNNVLESVSSSNVNISVRMKIYEQLSRDIEDKYINTLYNTYGWICEYMTCLEGMNKSIEYCNRDNEIKQTIYCLQPKISFE